MELLTTIGEQVGCLVALASTDPSVNVLRSGNAAGVFGPMMCTRLPLTQGVDPRRDRRCSSVSGAVILALILLAPLAHAERWKVQYFFDEPQEILVHRGPRVSIRHAWHCSGNHGSGNLITSQLIDRITDQRWRRALDRIRRSRTTHTPFSSSTNWWAGWSATTQSGLPKTSGHAWRRVGDQRKPDKKIGPTPPGGLITRVWFLDAQHGFAAGLQKSVLETHDSGKTWVDVDEAKSNRRPIPLTPSIARSFSRTNSIGIAVGGSVPPRPDDPRLPSLMEPERAT